jgi:hypothetical protein
MQNASKPKKFLGLCLTAIVLAPVLVSCASFKTVATEKLEGRQLIGHWESEDSHMNIYCNGSFSAKIPGDEIMRGDNGGGSNNGISTNTTSGKHIQKLTDHTFVVATYLPGSTETFHVQRWPYQSPQGWQMKVEGQDWKRTSYDSCR